MMDLFKKKLDNGFKAIWMRSLIGNIILLVVGILIALFPDRFLNAAAMIIGIITIIFGVLVSFDYFRNREDLFPLGMGIVISIFGLIFILIGDGLFRFIPFIVGLIMIINSISKLTYTLSMPNKVKGRTLSIVLTSINLVIGLIFFFSTLGTTIIAIMLGIIIIIYAITEIINDFIRRSYYKDFVNSNKVDKGVVIDADDSSYKEKK